MTEKPGIYRDEKSPLELRKDFEYILVISSDGKDFDVRMPKWLVPLINPMLIERCREIVNHVFYDIRPDLRPHD